MNTKRLSQITSRKRKFRLRFQSLTSMRYSILYYMSPSCKELSGEWSTYYIILKVVNLSARENKRVMQAKSSVLQFKFLVFTSIVLRYIDIVLVLCTLLTPSHTLFLVVLILLSFSFLPCKPALRFYRPI